MMRVHKTSYAKAQNPEMPIAHNTNLELSVVGCRLSVKEGSGSTGISLN